MLVPPGGRALRPEQQFRHGRAGGQGKVIRSPGKGDLISAGCDTPLTSLPVVAGQEARLGGNGQAARLPG